jgi:hypothetical protein
MFFLWLKEWILENPVGFCNDCYIMRCHCSSMMDRSDLFGRLLGEKNSVDVGKNSTACDGNTSEQLVQLLIVLDGKGDVTRDDTSLLVITGGIACKLEDLSAEVLKDGGKVDGCTGSHAGGVLSLTEEAANTADGELQSSLGGRAGGLLFAAASFSFS